MIDYSNIKVSFRLNNGRKISNSVADSYIYIRIRGGRRFDFTTSLNEKIPKRFWNAEIQRMEKKKRRQNIERDERKNYRG